ncbi:butyrophilin-like protein 2 [Cololabis saira]|uniref:butyrophilin-like protein 2 n=1 Tax=Cololabis saira TaxID=129043 RepID=UPI002AD323C9|nr:butyrophilin-like protein 2 [Cololabis saira]
MQVLVVSVVLLQVSQHASGVQVIDGEESVQLPCQVNISVSKDSTVVRSREELKYSIVHIRQQTRDDLMEQNKRYRNRTSMKMDALQTGDLSLTLRNPTISDGETYTCIVRRFGEELSRINVLLEVKERPPPIWPKVLPAVLVPLVLLASVFGLVFYLRYKRMKHNPVYKLEVVKASEGEESVILPF